MKKATKTFGWLALLMGSLTLSSAQPSGNLGFIFEADDLPVWDLTGLYSAGPTVISVQHDNNGRLRGSGAAMVQAGSDVVAASYKVSGAISGSGVDTRARFSVKLTGRDYIVGAYRRFNITMKYDLAVVASELRLVGTVKGKASYDGLGSETIDEPVDMPLPNGVDGSWAVAMNVMPLSKKLVGTGVVLVSTFLSPDLPGGWPTDRVLPADVRGSYNPKTDISKVSVKGVDEGRGTSLKLEFETDAVFPNAMSGKILGQRVSLP